jgi:acetylornithine deacetylase/succinyl-diaminopimelate desuccinylase-like protein
VSTLDPAVASDYTDRMWAEDAVPALREYIRIPNVSPDYCPTWSEDGHMDRAVELVRTWCVDRRLEGMSVEVLRLPGRTPLLFLEIPAAGGGRDDDPVLLYGHLDKQPEMVGWREGLGPWEPVVAGDRLYGRGAADDGYAVFAALGAVEAVRAAGGAHNRCVVLIEASEESGSPDLPAYFDDLAGRIGTPGLVVALDSDSTTYDRLWVTTSLRGIVMAVLDVQILTEGVHSGLAGGIVPSSFRILRRLLDRVEDPESGAVLVPEMHVEIPPLREAQLRELAAALGDQARDFPFVAGARPQVDSPYDALVASMWAPAIAVTGAEGLPEMGAAGNVLRPRTAVKLAVRVPPRCDAAAAGAALQHALTADPPYGARVEVRVEAAEDGWDAPDDPPWLERALDEASRSVYGNPPARTGVGGSIPFIAMLGRRFPSAAFVVTGVLGPGSNAHGPNEFLHLPTARRLTTVVAQVLHAHAVKA